MLPCRKQSSSSSSMASASPNRIACKMAGEEGTGETSLRGEVRGWPGWQSGWRKPGGNSCWSLSKRHQREAAVCSCMGSWQDAVASEELLGGAKCPCSPQAGVSSGVAGTTHCSDSQGPASGPGATRPLGAKCSPCPQPGALVAGTLGLLTRTKAAAGTGPGPAVDLRPSGLVTA